MKFDHFPIQNNKFVHVSSEKWNYNYKSRFDMFACEDLAENVEIIKYVARPTFSSLCFGQYYQNSSNVKEKEKGRSEE
jgi:hypothetical protein